MAHTLAEIKPQKFSDTLADLQEISYTLVEAGRYVYAEPVVETLVQTVAVFKTETLRATLRYEQLEALVQTLGDTCQVSSEIVD